VYTINDHNICCIVNSDVVYNITNRLHSCLFDGNTKNIYIIGTGLIGTSLIKRIHNISITDYTFNIIATINTRTMEHEDYGTHTSDLNRFIEFVLTDTYNNKIVVDCTSSNLILNYYDKLLLNNIGIVTPNKKGNTQSYQSFLRYTSYISYKYETTVCAGLPIISTLKNLLLSGDEILSIEGVLSGTLGYIFTQYNNTDKPFIDIVKQAEQLGYTEPNPLDDLNGVDVMRKILILARICGISMELDDVANELFLPPNCINSKTKAEFYSSLHECKPEKKAGFDIHYVASFKQNKASVGIQYVNKAHPLSGLKGNDNMVIITTKLYFKNPIVIQGPGAGAEVTSAGVLSDIIQLTF